MSFVILRGLCKQLPDRPLFDNLNLSLQEGELVTLLGPSGCGKSTLLRALAGLTPIDGGQILMAGEEITHRIPQQRQIGMVFQHYALFPNMNVVENIEFGLKIKKLPADVRAAKVQKVLELVELQSCAKQKPASLSGGQKQRVALARGLVMEPQLLLLDEPLSALDQARREELIPYLQRIRDEIALPMIYVSHRQEEVRQLTDAVHRLD